VSYPNKKPPIATVIDVSTRNARRLPGDEEPALLSGEAPESRAVNWVPATFDMPSSIISSYRLSIANAVDRP